jgi:hypothetical protein
MNRIIGYNAVRANQINYLNRAKAKRTITA